ncbi:MAG TPA: mannosyltransferase family protein [Thermomicrobiales bacterium]|jgi:4-amino-4-deoxy-L-arabinose transferase-like glycosyltransferase|nr:mannosyltransferase family protein [Thermomicrobiales bacterium]
MTPSTAAKAEPRRATGSDRFTFPLLVGAVHFIVVQLAAALASLYGTVRDDPRNDVPGALESAPQFYKGDPYGPADLGGLIQRLVEPLRSWDGLWYTYIADRGYADFSNANPAYWPLYPWMMELGNRITGWPIEVVGWLIANVAFIVALLFVYWIVQLDFDRQIARIALWVLALFPMAVFFSAVYTESLFLALAAGALYFARTNSWALAGILGLLAALSRSNGVMLLLPFAVLFIQQYGWSPRRWVTTGLASAAFAILPILGPLLFYLYLDGEGIEQTPTTPAFVEVQGQWYRYTAPPWETFRCAVAGCTGPADHEYIPENFQVNGADWQWASDLIDDPSWDNVTSYAWRDTFANSDTVELVALLLFIGLAILGLRTTPLYYSAYLLPPLLFPLFQPGAIHPLMSIPRFGIVLFPLFVVLALLLQRRGPRIAWLAVSTALLVLFTVQFAHWYWVS